MKCVVQLEDPTNMALVKIISNPELHAINNIMKSKNFNIKISARFKN